VANYIGRVAMGSVPVAAAPTTTKPNGGDEDMWAKALKSLPVEDQQEFKGLGGDMLGVLRGVSILSIYICTVPRDSATSIMAYEFVKSSHQSRYCA
jgi:hypothetical protein